MRLERKAGPGLASLDEDAGRFSREQQITWSETL